MHWCNQGTMDLFWKQYSTKFTGSGAWTKCFSTTISTKYQGPL